MISGMHPKGIKPKKQRVWAQGNYGRGGPVREKMDAPPEPAPEKPGLIARARDFLLGKS